MSGIWDSDVDHRDELISCGEELTNCVCTCLDCGQYWLWDCECPDSLYAAPEHISDVVDLETLQEVR